MGRWLGILFLMVLLVAIAVLIGRCAVTRSDDQISLSGVAGSHSASILVDGRRAAGCIDDEAVRTSSTVAVGNLMAPAACGSRVAVLVQDRAMHFDGSVGAWTDGSGDFLNVALAARPHLPLAIWVAAGGSGDPKVHLAAAGPFYDEMQCGIGFDENATITETAELGGMSAGCADLAPLRRVGFMEGRLNVYYVQEITDKPDARGIYCADIDPDVILVSTMLGLTATLAHEIGHALTLCHTNSVSGLNTYTVSPDGTAECNLMLQSGTNQRFLSTGQCFRSNLNSSSAINRLGARTGPAPECDDVNSTPACPALSFDVVPK